MILVDYSKKRLIIADMDGTLTESKAPMDEEMSSLLDQLLLQREFAVIGGGKYKQFQDQFVAKLIFNPSSLPHLYLFPTCGSTFYRFSDGGGEWTQVYAENLTEDNKKKIGEAFERALAEWGYEKPEKTYGQIIEDRGTQVTFSALGQEAPIEFKTAWDPDQRKRLGIKAIMGKYIPEFEIRVGGTTSIDVTRKGIDKAYGIGKMRQHLGYSTGQMLFIGDALFEGGNDAPAKTTGVDCLQVSGPSDTKKILREIIGSKPA